MTGWLALKASGVFRKGGIGKSQPQRAAAPQYGAWAQRPALKSYAVFDGEDLFSVGLYMVAPCLAEGPRAM